MQNDDAKLKILDIILADTFVKNTALKKTAALKDYLLAKVFQDTGSQSDDPELSLWVLKLDENLFSGINAKNIYGIFSDLEKSIKAIEPLVIYLPYELPQEEINKIGQKLRADYGKNFLTEIQIDPSIIGGCSLSYRGIYKDTSIKQKIMDNRKEILSIFRRYIKH